MDRRTQWEINQSAAGLTWINVQGRRHDMGKIKVRAYCASLLKAPEPKVD